MGMFFVSPKGGNLPYSYICVLAVSGSHIAGAGYNWSNPSAVHVNECFYLQTLRKDFIKVFIYGKLEYSFNPLMMGPVSAFRTWQFFSFFIPSLLKTLFSIDMARSGFFCNCVFLLAPFCGIYDVLNKDIFYNKKTKNQLP